MKYAVISDMHSNIEALTKVLGEIKTRNVNEIICLGDIVGYGANPDEVADLVRREARYVVRGNHDDALFDEISFSMINPYARAAIDYTRASLSADNYDWLGKIPMTERFADLLLAHASPSEPREWKYVFSEADAQMELSSFDEKICLIGHTHVPVIFRKKISETEVRELINVGSVGQPRDGDNRASFGIIDTGNYTYENIRIEYDYKAAASKIIAAGLPSFLAERLYKGR